ncbi:thioredoxin-like protein [Whalleya microplaca]|nr:thioredoxin-like protein [Whalleya microplaca]
MTSIKDLLSPMDETGSEEKVQEEDTVKPVNMALETTRYVLELILDPICPNCYIGLKSLNTAIETYKARHPEAVFEVTCSPFMLHPSAARSAYDKASYIPRTAHSFDEWNTLGEAVGIHFSWRGRTGSTRDAHKLLRFALESEPTSARSTHFARPQPHPQPQSPAAQPLPSPQSQHDRPPPQRGPALQMRLLSALLRAYHESDADLSDRTFLASTAAAATGLPRREIERVLGSERWGAAVDGLCAEVRRGRSVAIEAVPTLIVNDRYVIGGWQRAGFLVDEFERVGLGVGGAWDG